MSEPTIEEMKSDLLGGGWIKVRSDIWKAPWGALFYGPHKAWHIWAGTPMCEPSTSVLKEHYYQ